MSSVDPVTRREAVAAGVTVTELAGPRFRRIFHGVYVTSYAPASVRTAAASALRVVARGSRISHHSAAVLHGGWAPLSTLTHISVPGAASRSERRGIAAHRELICGRTVLIDGLPLSAASDVLLELARVGVGLVELVMVGDSLVKAGAVSLGAFVAAADAWTGPGVRRARRALSYVREGADSIMETRLRMLLVLAGLPEPDVNLILRHADGSWKWRFDLCYPPLRLIIEYDGRQHAENSRQWNSDLRRREELEREGWTLIVITSEAMFTKPGEVVERVRRAMVAAGARQRRRQPSPEWRRTFEPRSAA